MSGLQTLDEAIANIAELINETPEELRRQEYVVDECVVAKSPQVER